MLDATGDNLVLVCLYSGMKIYLILVVLFYLTGCISSKNHRQNVLHAPLMLRYDLVNKAISSKTVLIKRGEGLYQALNRIGVDNSLALKLINSLSDEVEFRTLKVGDSLKGFFDQKGNLVKFHFSQNAVDTHQLKRISNHWEYSLSQKTTRWVPKILSGMLSSNSTLENDLLKKGLSPSVVNDIISILICKVNFRMNARAGDKFKLFIYERKHHAKTVETKILYVSYSGKSAGSHESFLFEDQESKSTYTAHYTRDGEALIRSGLRYPLTSMHVRSNYGWRRHPVTGKRAFHRGIDLRGRRGKPVYAVADGRVIMSNYNKFAGNKVAVKHKDNSSSHYYHLSKRLVKKGDWVKVGKIIGNVGATGRVTGSHLHFGFKNGKGRWINPLSKRMIATSKLQGQRLERLIKQIAKIETNLFEIEKNKFQGLSIHTKGSHIFF